jgi:hypothetical protein
MVDPGPAPSNGLQIILPVVHDIEPGADTELCTWTDVIADHDIFIRSVQGYQGPAGHHLIIYKTKKLDQPGTTRKCGTNDLTEIRFVAGSGGEGMNATAPGDLAYTVEKGYQIVVNHHYINATPKPIDSQSAINIYFTEPGQAFTHTGAMVVVNTDFNLPQGSTSLDISCTLKNDLKVWFAIPHMHEFGTHIWVDHIPVNGTADRLFDVDPWDPSMTFHPPELTADPAQAMKFNTGDKVNVHCDWDNTSGGNLTFGIEMCVFFAQTVDDTGLGNLACDSGSWGDF